MDDYRKINILEDIEKLSKEIQLLLIEQIKSNNGYQEKINRLYNRLDKLNIELKRIIPASNDRDDQG
jgi:wyosine [tRNA(Phe)-imidazoG37] synthetase (radical SAM superfamily)